MKKIYLLFTLFLCHCAAFAQVLTVNATGPAGSYKTGYTQATAGRIDGNMVIAPTGSAAPRRGYAVFNLSALPGGTTVTSATLRFNYRTADTAAATVDSCSIFGYPGDLSAVTSSPALYAACVTHAPFNTTNWGADTGIAGAQDILPLLDTGRRFIQANHGGYISLGFATFSGVNVYTVTGESGSAAMQPQLAITYSCTGVTSVTATPSQNPVCLGSTVTLVGTGTGITSYSWSGPGGYTSTLESPSFPVTYGSVGVYTFTGTNGGGCPTTVTTAAIAVNSLSPTAINGTLHECANALTNLSDGVTGGFWSTSYPAVASFIAPTSGALIGATAGTTVVTYNTGCGYVTAIDTVYTIPTISAGTGDSVCVGSTTSFAYLPAGGTWTSSHPAAATVLSGSGLITGVGVGTSTIVYTIAHGCAVSKLVRVIGPPHAITGVMHLCPGTSVTLSDTLGGTWSSQAGYIASVVGSTGKVTGLVAGTAEIVFTDALGCSVHTIVTVNPVPLPIIGGVTGCAGSIDTLYDATSDGVWSSGTPSVAAVTGILLDTSAAITTLAGGTATISYTLPTGCAATKSFKVYPKPTPTVTYDWMTNTFYTQTFYVAYQWYDSAQNLITGATAPQTAALYNGNYWVVVTDTNGCSNLSPYVHYNEAESGISTQSQTLLHIYPNPATDMLYIESAVNVRAVISDLNGKTCLEQPDAKVINISKLADGIYIVSLYTDNGQRIVVQQLLKQ